MKHLHEKNEQFDTPHSNILDTFKNPGIKEVTLTQKEFTSICPITGQPDYAVISITYWPTDLCIESKSLKLYLAAFRNFPGFAETITTIIGDDIFKVLSCPVVVKTNFASRGGINIESTYSE